MQALLDVMDSQFPGNTVEDYLISAAVFLGFLVGLPIGKAIILRRPRPNRTRPIVYMDKGSSLSRRVQSDRGRSTCRRPPGRRSLAGSYGRP